MPDFSRRYPVVDPMTVISNQPIEVRELRSQFESWLNLVGEHALLTVRFGHGPTAPSWQPDNDDLKKRRTSRISA